MAHHRNLALPCINLNTCALDRDDYPGQRDIYAARIIDTFGHITVGALALAGMQFITGKIDAPIRR